MSDAPTFGQVPPETGWKRRMRFDPTEYSPEFQDESRRLWHEAARQRDEALAEVARLRGVIEDYILWEPRKAGHAEAHRRLVAALASPEART